MALVDGNRLDEKCLEKHDKSDAKLLHGQLELVLHIEVLLLDALLTFLLLAL